MTSEYEKAREANIKRNEDFLKDIGLDHLQEELRVAATTSDPTRRQSGGAKTKKRQRQRQRDEGSEADKRGGEGDEVPRRRSRRLQSTGAGVREEVEKEMLLYLNDSAEARRVPSSGWAQRREEGEHSKEHISEQQLLDYIQAADKEHFEGADLQGVKKCCERINYMSEAGLHLRLQRIKLTPKLILFYYGLSLAGLDRLAGLARAKLADLHGVLIVDHDR